MKKDRGVKQIIQNNNSIPKEQAVKIIPTKDQDKTVHTREPSNIPSRDQGNKNIPASNQNNKLILTQNKDSSTPCRDQVLLTIPTSGPSPVRTIPTRDLDNRITPSRDEEKQRFIDRLISSPNITSPRDECDTPRSR